MTDESRSRLERLLGGRELERLRGRLRGRYERGIREDEFTLNGLTPVERSTLETLLGRLPRIASSMRLLQSELDAVVARAGLAADLRSALEVLDGPLIDVCGERTKRLRDWQLALEAVRDERLRALLASRESIALLKRLVRSDPKRGWALLERTERVLACLPARGVPLAQLAAETLGDAHALDAREPVATLVLRACDAARTSFAPLLGDAVEARVFSEESAAGASRVARDSRRAQWASVGVSVNELAAPVLCLNLYAREDTPAGVLAAAAAERGEPVHLNLRTLLRQPPAWEIAGRTVYVCENASIVAIAADRLGRDAAPLVCSDGMPGAAEQTLLRQLGGAGARLRYHGDFDWPGVAIGNFVMRSSGAQSWRFRAVDYRAAPSAVECALAGPNVEASWDPDLAAAMVERGVAVHEEAVVERLLDDLAKDSLSRR